MERQTAFTFDDEEIHVLTEALAMYYGYQREMVLPMLVGDESDLDRVASKASASERLFNRFYDLDSKRDKTWEQASAHFENTMDRPMDVNDVSDFDWHKYRNGELNR
jgi:hypothetical protein